MAGSLPASRAFRPCSGNGSILSFTAPISRPGMFLSRLPSDIAARTGLKDAETGARRGRGYLRITQVARSWAQIVARFLRIRFSGIIECRNKAAHTGLRPQ